MKNLHLKYLMVKVEMEHRQITKGVQKHKIPNTKTRQEQRRQESQD